MATSSHASHPFVFTTRSGERYRAADIEIDESPMICCVALGDERGHVVTGSRLTGDFTPCTDAFDALALLRDSYPAAAVFSSVAERGCLHAYR